MSITETTTTSWSLTGTGYEFCNCQSGCTCNFNGFPTSPDGSCKAAVVNHFTDGRCGDVDLSGVTVLAIIDWPQAIHDGNGKAVFVVPPDVNDGQLNALAQIYTGQLGGMPWAILGTTFEIVGIVRAEVELDDNGMNSGFRVAGVGQASGSTLKNPVTGEDHLVAIELDTGFIWKRGDCGQGSFDVEAEGIHLSFQDTNWIRYHFDWTNTQA